MHCDVITNARVDNMSVKDFVSLRRTSGEGLAAALRSITYSIVLELPEGSKLLVKDPFWQIQSIWIDVWCRPRADFAGACYPSDAHSRKAVEPRIERNKIGQYFRIN
jgi:hypothetical protein